jgi:hypothetical protein
MSAVRQLPADELAARLEALTNGPWFERGQRARQELAAREIDWHGIRVKKIFDFGTLNLSPVDLKLSKKLERILRPHWIEIPSERAQEVRASLDDALTYLQLIELAVETGYLDTETIRTLAREQMASLLWSKAARRFVRDYDYVSIEHLAARVDLGGMSGAHAPGIDYSGELYFAAFLATERAIESDPAIDQWLDFLDDYVVRADEQGEFHDFLSSGKPAKSERRAALTLGAQQYVRMLADFLAMLPDDLQPRFGSFHAYWLAKLFGYERRSSGYVRNTRIWGKRDDCWAKAMSGWLAAQPDAKVECGIYDRSVATLQETWHRLIKVGSVTVGAAVKLRNLEPQTR